MVIICRSALETQQISKHAGENMRVNERRVAVVTQVPAYQMCTVSIDSSAGEGEAVSESDTGLGSRLSKDIQRHFAPAATLVSRRLHCLAIVTTSAQQEDSPKIVCMGECCVKLFSGNRCLQLPATVGRGT
jgi:hypothetical protein